MQMATFDFQPNVGFLDITIGDSTGLVIKGTDADGLPTSVAQIGGIDLSEGKYNSKWNVDKATWVVTAISSIGGTQIKIAFSAQCTDTGSRPPPDGSGRVLEDLEFLTVTATITPVMGAQNNVTNNMLQAGP
jgi:hypothetical protein